jgi:hypothetical protein
VPIADGERHSIAEGRGGGDGGRNCADVLTELRVGVLRLAIGTEQVRMRRVTDRKEHFTKVHEASG